VIKNWDRYRDVGGVEAREEEIRKRRSGWCRV